MRLIRREREVSTRNDGKRRSDNRVRRAKTLEVLEGRLLLAADAGAAISGWHNSVFPLDVNYDSQITPRDALLIINDLLANGSHSDATQAISTSSTVVALAASASSVAPSDALDVNGDGKVTPADVLAVINQLSAANPNAIVEYRLEVEDLNGNVISGNTIAVGQDFQLAMFVHDLRNPAAAHGGVFAGFANVAYDSNVTIPAGETTVNHDPLVIHGASQAGFFTLSPSGDLSTTGQITGAGGAGTSLTAPGPSEQALWTLTMHAASAGTENFTSSFDASSGHDTLLYDRNPPVPSEDIQFDPTSLTITSSPTVISIVPADANPTNLATVHYTVTFSESVTGVDTSDFTLLPSGGISGAAVTDVTGSGSSYTVTVDTGSGDGTLALQLLNDGTIKDSANLGLSGTFPFVGAPPYTIEKTAPTVVLPIVLTDPILTGLATVHFTVNFSHSVTGVVAGDFSLVPTGAITGASIAGVSGSGSSYTVTVNTGSGNGTLALSLSSAGTIADAVGNPLGSTLPITSSPYTIDKTAPTVVLGLSDATPTNLATVHFTVNFSKTVTGVSAADFTLVAGGISGATIASVNGSGSSYTVAVNTGTGDGTLALKIPSAGTIVDLAGNPLAGTPITSLAYTIDKPPSVLSIAPADPSPTKLATVHYTVIFSKSVTGVDEASFTDFVLVSTGAVTGAAITSITGSGSTYTVTVSTGSGDGTLALKLVDNGTIKDAEGVGLGGVLPFTGTPYTISHNLGEKASIRLQLSRDDANHDLDPSNQANWIPAGTPLNPSDTFMLAVFVQDTRAAGIATGISTAYLNAIYDSSLVSVATTNGVNDPIIYGPDFMVAQSGSTGTPGQIVEAGATSGNLTLPANPAAEDLLFSIPMVANNIGLATFTPLAANLPNHQVFEYLNNQPIPTSAISFVSTQINIGQNVFVFSGATPGASPNVSLPEGTPSGVNNVQTPFVFNVTWFMPDSNLQTATVQYSTSDGTATTPTNPTNPDNDYVPTTGVLTFTAGGPTTLPITILVNGDTKNEADETFSVNLTTLPGQPVATTSSAIGTILNDDGPVSISIGDATAKEGSKLVFTASLSAVSGQTVTVAYNTMDLPAGPNSATAGQDYTPVVTPVTLSFAPGVTQQTFTVATLTDLLIESTESFQIVLSNPSHVTLPSVLPRGHILDVPPATISGSVYVDINNDGIRQVTETGIANVPITATATINGISTSQTTFTKADGTFTFIVQPGVSYTITETQPGFFVDGKDTYPSGAISQTNDQFTGIVLASSQQASGYNFGEMGLRAQFASAFFNRRALFSSTVVGTQFGALATPLNLLNGDVWISFDGGWQGQRTILALFNPAQGSATMTLYDYNLNLLAISVPTTIGAQLQFNGGGVTYFLKVSGTNSNVSLSINDPQLAANLTQPQGTTSSAISAPTGNSSPAPTTTPSSIPTSGATSSFASSSMAAPAVQSLAANANDSEDATDAALANEDDWVTQPLTA
jgi:hypothetical protein